jgi:hypothetical protein
VATAATPPGQDVEFAFWRIPAAGEIAGIFDPGIGCAALLGDQN